MNKSKFSIITSYDDLETTQCLEKIIVNPTAYLDHLLSILKEVQLVKKYKIDSQSINNSLKKSKQTSKQAILLKLLSTQKVIVQYLLGIKF